MAEPVVLDTSVVVKWFRQGEALAGRALSLRDAYLDGRVQIVVPNLLAYELANVLRYKPDLATAQVQDALDSLFAMELWWEAPGASLMRRAVALARSLDVTVYDATIAALAEGLGAPFITADERLARRLRALPFVRFLGVDGQLKARRGL